MTKHRKNKEKMVQSTLRIPHSLWKRINAVAEGKRLSMAQAVERAVYMYCYVIDGEVGPEGSDFLGTLGSGDWQIALSEIQEQREKREREKQKKEKR